MMRGVTPDAPILEHAVLDVVPGQELEFERAFAEARKIIAAADGFRSLRLARCLERPNRYLLLVEWESLEDHVEGFREIGTLRPMATAPPPLLRPLPHRRALRRGDVNLSAG